MLRAIFFLTLIQMLPWQAVYGLGLQASDIAIVMPKDRLGLDSQTGLLKETWYNQVKKGYLGTSVGNALDLENSLSDWQLVSIRIVPCAPLGVSPKQNI